MSIYPLRCPVCHQPLQNSDSGLKCSKNHHFDRARQGYINLLPGHKKRSQNPGDDKLMVDARTKFLDTGHYAPVADGLIKHVQDILSDTSAPTIIDAGCGEGYYTNRLKTALPSGKVIGFDISRPAIMACSKRYPDIQWLVASVNDIPVLDSSADLVISIFSRCDWQQFSRILKPGGTVVVLSPGSQHLHELREVIYEQVRPYPEDKLQQSLPEGFSLVDVHPIQGSMELSDSETLMNLLAMTPHYWRIKPQQKEKLLNIHQLSCRFDMRLTIIKKEIV